ncbi:Malonic semialdehyde reductase RutE [Glutamicibacter creatinolyticus]|uniref:Malonic semialdehyde reductase RutE n=1 Tax=Glutamicibacter creatinolyticus TaxID=162496 RepID=A0A5B7WRZ5_9MICC|nr:malonic semialdehyde reductase [Glutamicibacter creatinolyticus]QCY46085.1 Malonic semialdehyde reductase RutE [Glutamicibacter creatinolyticus]
MTQQAYATAHDAYTIDPAAMDQLFFEARSANSFSGEPVSDESLEAIYDAMKMGPTLMNNQPLRISWIKSDEARNAIAATMSGSNAAKALAAPALAVLSFDPEWHEQFPKFFPHAPERKAMFEDAESRAAVGSSNAWLQAGYFLMAVRAVGLAAGPMGGFDHAAVDAAINEETGHKSFMIVNVGKPGANAWMERLPRHEAKFAVRNL